MVKTEKRVLIAVLVFLVLSVSGCRRAVDEPTEYNYRTGTQGLVLSFPVDTPREVYENDRNVRFMVEVKNQGAFPQSDEVDEFRGKLWAGGYDEDIVEIFPREGDIKNGVELDGSELEGKSVYNKDGGVSAVEFQMNVKDLPQGMPYYRPKLMVIASYFYKTIANPMICIDPEPRSTRVREKVCNIGDYSGAGSGGGSGTGGRVGAGLGSQGAPITLTKIEEDVTGEDILFKIYIQNSGQGIVILENDIDNNPNKGYDWRDTDLVRIDDIRAGNTRMTECRPSKNVQLIDGKGYIFCRLSKSGIGENAYVTPLNIQLSYGYTTSIQRDIEIFEEVSFS